MEEFLVDCINSRIILGYFNQCLNMNLERSPHSRRHSQIPIVFFDYLYILIFFLRNFASVIGDLAKLWYCLLEILDDCIDSRTFESFIRIPHKYRYQESETSFFLTFQTLPFHHAHQE